MALFADNSFDGFDGCKPEGPEDPFGPFHEDDSPCPEVVKYLPSDGNNDTWTADIHLPMDADDELLGVWIQIILDGKANTLTNWFGEVSTPDNQVFAIRKPEHIIRYGPQNAPLRVRTTYNPNDDAPAIKTLRMNGRTICGGPKRKKFLRFRPFQFGPMGVGSPQVPSIPKLQPQPESVVKKENKENTTTEEETNTGLPPNLSEIFASLNTSKSEKPLRSTPIREQEHTDFSKLPSAKGPVNPVYWWQPADQDIPCGTPAHAGVKGLISKGEASLEGAWPWHAAIYLSLTLSFNYICGGTLLTRRHVLTAAHCLTYPENPDAYVLHFGRLYLTSFSKGIQERKVKRIILHEEYNRKFLRNDLAMMYLEEPVAFSDYVRHVCLWPDADATSIVNEVGRVVGWGIDETNNYKERLHEASMPVVDLLQCVYSQPELYGRYTTVNNFCAGFKNGTSVCNGDSGGGMFFERQIGNDTVKRWEIRGIVSFSKVLRNDLCDPNAYVVFTDVLKYGEWIKGKLALS